MILCAYANYANCCSWRSAGQAVIQAAVTLEPAGSVFRADQVLRSHRHCAGLLASEHDLGVAFAKLYLPNRAAGRVNLAQDYRRVRLGASHKAMEDAGASTILFRW
jgi:hypothetical protein